MLLFKFVHKLSIQSGLSWICDLWNLYRRSPHFVISEFVIPAISWFGFRHYFVKIPPFRDFEKKMSGVGPHKIAGQKDAV